MGDIFVSRKLLNGWLCEKDQNFNFGIAGIFVLIEHCKNKSKKELEKTNRIRIWDENFVGLNQGKNVTMP